jgi:hypothetical protein
MQAPPGRDGAQRQVEADDPRDTAAVAAAQDAAIAELPRAITHALMFALSAGTAIGAAAVLAGAWQACSP